MRKSQSGLRGSCDRGQLGIIALVAVVALCACGSVEEVSQPPLSSSSDAHSGLLERPRPSQYLSWSEETQIYSAWQMAVQRCMAAAGFEYQPLERDQSRDYEVDPLDEGFAREWGYHRPPSSFEQRKAVSGSQTPTAFDIALNGSQGAGCSQWAYDYVYNPMGSSYVADIRTFDMARSQLKNAASADEEVVAAVASWSSCMGAEGYAFQNQEDAANWAYQEYGDFIDSPADREVQVRLADIACDQRVHLTDTYRRVLQSLESGFDQGRASEINELTQSKTQFIKTVGLAMENLTQDFNFPTPS